MKFDLFPSIYFLWAAKKPNTYNFFWRNRPACRQKNNGVGQATFHNIHVILILEAMNDTYKDPLFDIIEGCVRGDGKCQQIIYQKFYGKMLGACMRYSKDREEARDILQDGFVKVFTNIKKYGGSGSFEGWIRKVIVNTALDSIRKNKKMIQYADSDYVEANAEDPSTSLRVTTEEENNDYVNISTEEIMNAVQQLPTAYRTVFNMFVVDGFTHKEIAEELGINAGTSKSNLSKAKMHLKKLLAPKIKSYQK